MADSSTAGDWSSSSSSSSSSSTAAATTAITLSTASAGLIAYGVFCFSFVVVFTAALIWYYARPKMPPTVGVLVYLAWLCAFVVCFLVPIDLIASAEGQLDTVWSVCFWNSFMLMWVIIPLASGYYDNGAFTFKEKMKASLRTNLILFCVAGVLLIIGVIYLRAATDLTWTDMSGLAVAASNTWGLAILVCMAGYGLVDFPRTLWNHSHLQRRREEVAYGAASIHDEADTARDELHHTLIFLRTYQEKVDETANEEYQENFRQILNECREQEIALGAMRRRAGPYDKEAMEVLEDLKKADAHVSTPNLVKLNLHVKGTVRHLQLVEAQWRDAVKEFVDLDAAIGTEDRAGGRAPADMNCFAKLLWYVRIRFLRRILRVSAICSMVLSALLIWMEFFLPFDFNVSPLGAIINSDAVQDSPLALQIFSVIPITYLSICTYFPLFNMRLSKFYYIGPGRTDENSLLFNATFMLRAATPLAYNFVLLLDVNATSLGNFIGVIDVIPFFGGSFTTVFPWFIFVIALMTLLNVWAIAGRLLNMQRFSYIAAGSASAGTEAHQEVRDAIAEGKKLIESFVRTEHRLREQQQLAHHNANERMDSVMLVNA